MAYLCTPCTSMVRQGDQMRNYIKRYSNLPYNPHLREYAKELRKAGNLCEVLMWQQFRNKSFKGYDFDRQKIIGNYIVDFFCLDCGTVIEIDGSSHDNKAEYDKERDDFLIDLGLNVIHIRAVDVLSHMDDVMTMLCDHPALRAPCRMLHILSGRASSPSKEGNCFVGRDALIAPQVLDMRNFSRRTRHPYRVTIFVGRELVPVAI